MSSGDWMPLNKEQTARGDGMKDYTSLTVMHERSTRLHTPPLPNTGKRVMLSSPQKASTEHIPGEAVQTPPTLPSPHGQKLTLQRQTHSLSIAAVICSRNSGEILPLFVRSWWRL